MGKASRRKREARTRFTAPAGTELPTTYFDVAAREMGPLMDYVGRDIARAKEGGKTLNELIPPLGEGKLESEWAINMGRTELARNPALAQQFGAWDQAMRLRWLETYTRTYRAILGFEHSERTAYFVHESLSEALAYTQLNVACDHFRLPVEGMALVLHDDISREAFHAIATKTAGKAQGSTITAFLRTDELDQVGCRRLLIFAIETYKNGDVGAAVGRYLALRSDWDMERALRTDWAVDQPSGAAPRGAMVIEGGKRVGEEYEIEEAAMETFFDRGVMFARMVVNAVLYVSSRHAIVHERADGRYPSAPGEEAARARTYKVLGEGTDAPFTTVERKGAEIAEAGGGRTGRRLTVRYLQAGFWRRPPNTDPGHPKDVWVSPHYRGPDAAELLHRARVVK